MTIVYDTEIVPVAGEFLASISRKDGRIMSVYHVAEVRKVNSKLRNDRYSLNVLSANDVRNAIVVAEDGSISIHGITVHPIYWYERTKQEATA